MAVKIKDDVINVYGDNLESCLYARSLANNNPTKNVIHYSGNELGGIHNESSGTLGILSLDQVNKIISIVDFEFIQIDDFVIKIPYSKIPFSNTTDGNIRFPFTRDSFDSEYDFNDVIQATPTYQEFITTYKSTKNIVKTVRDIFSDSFYMDIVKKIGTNYYNVTQSQIEASFIYRELLQLQYLGTNQTVKFYIPKGGYTKLCEALLSAPNIVRVSEPRKISKTRVRSNPYMNYIFEYYDYYLDYIFGPIEYIKREPIHHKTSLYNVDEISISITPYDKKYGMYYKTYSNIYGVRTSNCTLKSDDFDQCSPMPTHQNIKKINEYNSLVNNIPNIVMYK